MGKIVLQTTIALSGYAEIVVFTPKPRRHLEK
jgi:hypothetical protein